MKVSLSSFLLCTTMWQLKLVNDKKRREKIQKFGSNWLNLKKEQIEGNSSFFSIILG